MRTIQDISGKRLQSRRLAIKALFSGGQPALDRAADYPAAALLVECAGGPLPGGNALTWDWGAARGIAERYPLVLAGGLDAENVARAIAAAKPAAVDVSSGVESAPGHKDAAKVRAFIAAVDATHRFVTHRIFPSR